MNDEQDEQQAIDALSEKLYALYCEWEKNRPEKEVKHGDGEALVYRAILLALCNDPEEMAQLRKEHDALIHPQPEEINITLSPTELLKILLGLVYLNQSIEAERYVQESLSKNVTHQQRWETVSKIMLINNPDEKLRLNRDKEFHWYCILVDSGVPPRKASEEVCKKFNHGNRRSYESLNDDEKIRALQACDKWLNDEITRKKKEFPDLFWHIKKPSKSERTLLEE